MTATRTELPTRPAATRSGFWPSKRELSFGLLLVLVTLAVYAQVRRFEFMNCWDDQKYVTENLHVQSGLTWHGVRWAFSHAHDSNWCPLTWLSLMTDASLYKTWAGGFHLTNIAFHVLNVLLVFTFFSRTTGEVGRSAFVAALFAVHPLHVESVAWITERKDVLSMFFGLLAMLAYARYARQQSKVSLIAAIALFAMSLLSKATFVTLPFLLLLLDFWPLNRLSRDDGAQQSHSVRQSRSLKRLFIEKLPFLAIGLTICNVAVVTQSSGPLRSFADISFSTRLANSVLAYGLYLKRLFWPVDLAMFYPHPGDSIDLRDVGTVGALLLAISLVAVATMGRRRYVLVGWSWFLTAMLPMIGLIQVGPQQMADRYAYLPFLGLYAAIVWLVPSLVRQTLVRRRVLPALGASIVVIFAVLAFRQTAYWHDGLTLMRRNVAVSRENAFATRLLGDAFFLEERQEEAIEQYRRAIQLEPDDAQYPGRLAFVFGSLGQHNAAIEQLRTAIALDDGNAMLHASLGSAYIAIGRYPNAKYELGRALELDEKNPWTLVQLASLCRLIKDYSTSNSFCRDALELDETLTVCHKIAAMNLRDEGRIDAAVEWLRRAESTSLIDDDTRTLLADMIRLQKRHSIAGN